MENTGEDDQKAEEEMEIPKWFSWLFAAGFAVVFIGIALVVFAAVFGDASGSLSSGVVILLGPFPIVFGSGPDAVWLILIGIVIAIISLVSFVVLRRKRSWVEA